MLISILLLLVTLYLVEAPVKFLWWVGVGVHSHFHVQPNHSVDVVLWFCCVLVGVVTINIKRSVQLPTSYYWKMTFLPYNWQRPHTCPVAILYLILLPICHPFPLPCKQNKHPQVKL